MSDTATRLGFFYAIEVVGVTIAHDCTHAGLDASHETERQIGHLNIYKLGDTTCLRGELLKLGQLVLRLLLTLSNGC